MQIDILKQIHTKAASLGLSEAVRTATFRAHNTGVLTADDVRAAKFAYSYEKQVNAELLEFMDKLTCECVPPWGYYSTKPTPVTDPQRRQHLGLDGPGAFLKGIIAHANKGGLA